MDKSDSRTRTRNRRSLVGWVLFGMGIVGLMILGTWVGVAVGIPPTAAGNNLGETLDHPTVFAFVTLATFTLLAGGLRTLVASGVEASFTRHPPVAESKWRDSDSPGWLEREWGAKTRLFAAGLVTLGAAVYLFALAYGLWWLTYHFKPYSTLVERVDEAASFIDWVSSLVFASFPQVIWWGTLLVTVDAWRVGLDRAKVTSRQLAHEGGIAGHLPT